MILQSESVEPECVTRLLETLLKYITCIFWCM